MKMRPGEGEGGGGVQCADNRLADSKPIHSSSEAASTASYTLQVDG